MALTEQELEELAAARSLLENPGLAVRLSRLLGVPVDTGMALLPVTLRGNLQHLTEAGLLKATEAALWTLEDRPGRAARERWHRLGATVSGGVGGLFGTSTLLAELSLSTTIMLRSIADVARSEGESLRAPEFRVHCLEVFALGGGRGGDDGSDTAYYSLRALLATQLRDAAEHVACHGVTHGAGPAVVQFVARVARYFGIQVSRKLAAQSLPAFGAVGGAAVNALFTGHYQDVARGHFVIRRLERTHGQAAVRDAYAAPSRQITAQRRS